MVGCGAQQLGWRSMVFGRHYNGGMERLRQKLPVQPLKIHDVTPRSPIGKAGFAMSFARDYCIYQTEIIFTCHFLGLRWEDTSSF